MSKEKEFYQIRNGSHLERRKRWNRSVQLRFAREYRGYSQTELASHIKGLSQPMLSKYEKGVGLIPENILEEIMKFLNFPFSFIDVEMGRISVCG